MKQLPVSSLRASQLGPWGVAASLVPDCRLRACPQAPHPPRVLSLEPEVMTPGIFPQFVLDSHFLRGFIQVP